MIYVLLVGSTIFVNTLWFYPYLHKKEYWKDNKPTKNTYVYMEDYLIGPSYWDWVPWYLMIFSFDVFVIWLVIKFSII